MKEERKAKYVTPQIEIIAICPVAIQVCLVEAAPEDLRNVIVQVA